MLEYGRRDRGVAWEVEIVFMDARVSAFKWLAAFSLMSALASVSAAQFQPSGCLSAAEEELLQLINAYRQENALPPVPASTALTAVAQWHVEDTRYAVDVSGEYGQDGSCNLHTWYGIPAAPYSTCCYTSDHAQAACMWNKPDEISAGSYTASGYEIAATGYSSVAAALNGWKNSPGHNNVILNQDIWASQTWAGIGVGVDETRRWYYVWFSTQTDPQGAPASCGTPVLTSSWAAIKAHFD